MRQNPAKRISDIDIQSGYANQISVRKQAKQVKVTKQFFRNLPSGGKRMGEEEGEGRGVFFEIGSFIPLTARCITSRSSPESWPRVYRVSKR